MKTSERAKRLAPDNKHEQRFYDCPGAWVGNMPGLSSQFPLCNQGNIVVDPSKVIYACHWLRKFYTLTGGNIHDAGCGGNLGYMITFETKGKEWIAYEEPDGGTDVNGCDV